MRSPADHRLRLYLGSAVQEPTGQCLASPFVLSSLLFNPSIGFDSADNQWITFTESSGSEFPRADVIEAPAGQTPPTTASASVIASGLTYYCDTEGWSSVTQSSTCQGQANTQQTIDRWGDYSSVAPDMASGGVWIGQEFASAASTDPTDWGTAIAHLSG